MIICVTCVLFTIKSKISKIHCENIDFVLNHFERQIHLNIFHLMKNFNLNFDHVYDNKMFMIKSINDSNSSILNKSKKIVFIFSHHI